jgi:hypothetical protein
MSSPDQNSLNMSDFVGNWELVRERTSIEFHTKARLGHCQHLWRLGDGHLRGGHRSK